MRKVILTVLMATAGLFSIAQKKTKPVIAENRFAGLDTAFERVLKDWKAPGFAVAVVEKDKVVYAKGFGYRNYEKQEPVTPHTLFAIGSCTKAFTSALLGLLQKDGKLELDKPVRNYLPDFKFYNNDMNNHITLRDMMSHRTGLPRHDYSWYLFKSGSRDTLVQRIQYQEPSVGIRERWQYNNFMFLLQGMVAEKLTAKSWEENVSSRIFKPLGMNQSNFSVKDMEGNADAALGYGLKKDSIIKKLAYHNINAMGPAGSINSNVMEMANWVIAWINGGKFNNKEILPASYVADAMSAQMVANTGIPSKERPDIYFANYGLGWSLSSYKGHYRVDHGGNIDGFSANTCFFPSDSVGIIVLTNQDRSSVTSVVRNLVADRMLQLPYFDWNTDLKQSTDKAKAAVKEAEKTTISNRKADTRPSHADKDLAGVYQHLGYGSFEIESRNDSLFARIEKEQLWLRHYHYNIYEPFTVDAKEGIDTTNKIAVRFQFHMSETGEINATTLKMEPTLPALRFTKTPKPKAVAKEDLQKYTGDYVLGNATVKVYIKDEKTLFVLVPGQPDYELIPLGVHKFSLKVAEGYYVQFELNDKNESIALTFIQPNGNFKARKKEL